MLRKTPTPHFERVNEFIFSDGDRGNSAQSGHVIVRGDPEASRRRSKQTRAVVIGVAGAALDEVKAYYNKTRKPFKEEKFTPAGAYYDRRAMLHAAELGDKVDFGEVELEDGRNLRSIALHQGPHNTYMTIGFISSKRSPRNLHREMLIPRGVEIIERDIEIPDLPQRYPGVPLI